MQICSQRLFYLKLLIHIFLIIQQCSARLCRCSPVEDIMCMLVRYTEEIVRGLLRRISVYLSSLFFLLTSVLLKEARWDA